MIIPSVTEEVDSHDMEPILALDDFVNFCVVIHFVMLSLLYVVKLDL